ncbi:MAG TPA: hypothetical protein VME18_07765 [Acidobacteriaceae bacterium]|nr:hypothetical protein [Acidobacteriaceae bacterium]
MFKREAVLLVSRAIAAIELIAAVENIIYLIRNSLNFVYFGIHSLPGPAWQMSGQLAALLFQLLVALLFWKCGPRVADFLLPASEGPKDIGQPG